MSGGSKKTTPETGGIEQAVSRALRDNLEKLQRSADELHQAIADTVAACASSKASNALPPMLRAQTAAASLAASLDVLTRFVASALRPAQRSLVGEEVVAGQSLADQVFAGQVLAGEGQPEEVSTPEKEAPEISTAPIVPPAETPPKTERPRPRIEPIASTGHVRETVQAQEEKPPVVPRAARETSIDETAESLIYRPPVEKTAQFDLSRLPQDEQDLHRRANRVAKVSMQDIKMLRPEQVKAGLEHKDICARLRDDIAKAHKEYDRRFRPIMQHPVDYFYHWMVEILAEGDPQALGEYPYSSPVRNR